MPSQDRQRGFTMIELMIVIVIILVVTAVAIPAVMTATYNVRLRSSGSQVGGLLQSARMRAIRDNRTYPLNCMPQPANDCVTLYVDLSGTGNGAYQAGAAVVELPGTVRFSTAGFPAIPQATLGFVPLVNQQIYFNPRGLPCSRGGGGVCTNNGFVFYFQDQRALGTNGYGAVAITPAGRIRVYSYNLTHGWYQS